MNLIDSNINIEQLDLNKSYDTTIIANINQSKFKPSITDNTLTPGKNNETEITLN